ncbi:MAG: transglutaminase domain-containing protein [Planctomycetaceae bacterium]
MRLAHDHPTEFGSPAAAQRLMGWLLLCIEAAAMALLSWSVTFPLAIVVVALVGWLLSPRLQLGRRTAFYLLMGMALCFMIKAAMFPHEFPRRTVFFGSTVTHAMAQFFLAWQAALFFLDDRDRRLPTMFPMLGAVGLMAMANVIVGVPRQNVLQGLVIGYVLLSGAYFMAGRRSPPAGERGSRARTVALWTVAGLVGTAAWLGAYALNRFEGDIENFLNHVLLAAAPPEFTGYSGTGEFGSVAHRKHHGGERIALRIVSPDAPGYLRGRAFDVFSRGRWRTLSPSERLKPQPAARQGGLPPLSPGMSMFQRRPARAMEWRTLAIWADVGDAEAIFAPWGTTHVQAPVTQVVVNRHGIFEIDGEAAPDSYVVIGPRGPVPNDPDDAPSTEFLAPVPRRYERPENRVARFAAELFAGTDDPAEKVRRVERHFLDNYQYRLGINPPPDRDVLEWFIIDRPPAHCEFFAAATATLLRLGGVHCRYVTGFVAHEWNDFGGYWVARDRDAHAWVEAWVPGRGWVTVESTPAEGVPSEAESAGRFARFWESIRGRLRMVWSTLGRDGFQTLLARSWSKVIAMPGLLLSCALIGSAWLAIRVRRRNRKVAPRDPIVRAMHRLRRRVDRRLRRAGLVRGRDETLHHFAERILSAAAAGDDGLAESLRTAAQWYREYARVRYRGNMGPDSIAALARSLPGTERT